MKKILFLITLSAMVFSADLTNFSLAIGDPAPKWMLYNFNNVIQKDMDLSKTIKFSSLVGKKAIVLSFFTRDCVNCKFEIPELQKISLDYTNANVVFYLVLIKTKDDTVENMTDDITNRGYTLPILYHGFPDTVLKSYIKNKTGELNPVPLLYIIDLKGNISFMKVGFDRNDVEKETAKIRKSIDRALTSK